MLRRLFAHGRTGRGAGRLGVLLTGEGGGRGGRVGGRAAVVIHVPHGDARRELMMHRRRRHDGMGRRRRRSDLMKQELQIAFFVAVLPAHCQQLVIVQLWTGGANGTDLRARESK